MKSLTSSCSSDWSAKSFDISSNISSSWSVDDSLIDKVQNDQWKVVLRKRFLRESFLKVWSAILRNWSECENLSTQCHKHFIKRDLVMIGYIGRLLLEFVAKNPWYCQCQSSGQLFQRNSIKSMELVIDRPINDAWWYRWVVIEMLLCVMTRT
jgi:hypothetical protein